MQHRPEDDPDALEQVFALIYTPRRGRKRFPENCVRVVASEDEARAGAAPDQHLHPAKVCGPLRSSEGFRLYYLVAWLE